MKRVAETHTTSTSERDLDRAASIVASHCLRLAPGEHFVVFADQRSLPIATALHRAARTLDAASLIARLDEIGVRPLKIVPDAWVRELAMAQATAFVADTPREELAMRQHLLHLVSAHRVRHAHMPGISPRQFVHGMRGDFSRVEAFGRRLLEKLATPRVLRSESALGTNLHITLGRSGRWFSQLGVLEPGRWGNLPAGALYTSPENVDGIFVANASLGEFFGAREGLLARKPVRFTIRDSRVVRVEAQSPTLQREIEATLSFSPNSRRIGLVCIGVNVGITSAMGDPLVDQNLPGLHVAFGDPAARATGADWTAPTSFAACQSESSVLIDETIVIHRGRLPGMV